MQEVQAMAFADALRGYIRHLRREQNVPLLKMAEALGIARNTYIAWEKGGKKGGVQDMKVPRLIQAFRLLDVPLDYLEKLGGAETEDEGRKLAQEWLDMTVDQRAQVHRIETKFQQVIDLGERDPEQLAQIVERLREDSQNDPALLDLVNAYLDGRRSHNLR